MKYLILSIIILSNASCYSTFFNAADLVPVDTKKLQGNISAGNKFYVHTPENISSASNVVINKDNITADIDPLTKAQKKYMNPASTKPNSIQSEDESEVLNSTHIYTSKILNDTGRISFQISEIDRIVIYELDKKATKDSKTGAAVITSILGAGLIGGAVALLVVPVL